MPVEPSGTVEGHERARALVLRHGWNPSAYQILNPGMRLWFSAAGDAVSGMVEYHGTWVVAGAPVCEEARLPAVAGELAEDAFAARAAVVYFGAGERLERHLAAARTHRLIRLGAMPVWEARAWPATVASKASLRAQIHRARNKHVRVRETDSRDAGRDPRIRAVLDVWLGARGLPPLHFMTEPDLLGDLRDRRVFVAERGDRLVAFLVATPVPARNGWLIEEWPRLPEAPNGTMQLLVDSAMRAFAEAGCEFVTLGLAPLSERAGPIGDGEPRWLRLLLRWMRAHGRRFYNFRGLDAFKAALAPAAWEPLYVAMPRERSRARTLWAIAGVFGGGSPVRLLAAALRMAVARELRASAESSGASRPPASGR